MKTKFFHYAAIGLFVFGLSFLLVSHFQPPSVLGWQLQGFIGHLPAVEQALRRHGVAAGRGDPLPKLKRSVSQRHLRQRSRWPAHPLLDKACSAGTGN